MALANQLQDLIRAGVHRIGEIEILTDFAAHPFALCHFEDRELALTSDFGTLEVHEDPAAARELSTYSPDGTYRFTKGEISLKSGWIMPLENDRDLLLALDHFYPAGVGLFVASRNGTLEVQHVRDKLNRQTGMYKPVRNASDELLQSLVKQVCGPAHRCAKKILWQIDAATPLEDSEALHYNGVPGDVPEVEAIPLLCREACNHFVAECRRAGRKK